MSEATLCSSPRLVGGVEVGGDALIEERDVACFSVSTAMHETVDIIDAGDVSLSAMALDLGVWEVWCVEEE